MMLIKWILSITILLILAAGSLYLIAGLDTEKLDDEAREKASGSFIDLTDGKLHYRWDGPVDGPVVVMVHGYSTPLFIFENNSAALNEAGFRTLRFDHFGRGWSDRPRVKYDIEFYDRTLLELLDGLELTEPVGLVGLSMGGVISAEFAARHPERVEKLFLLAPAGLDLEGAGTIMTGVMNTPVLGDWIWRMSWESIMESSYEEAAAELPDEIEIAGDPFEQMDYSGFSEALLSTFRHLPMAGRDEAFAQMASTGIPVRAAFGADDKTVLISSAGKLSEIAPGTDMHVFGDAGHGLNLQRAKEINELLVEWFTPVPSISGGDSQ